MTTLRCAGKLSAGRDRDSITFVGRADIVQARSFDSMT